jgi:hypothetical protein
MPRHLCLTLCLLGGTSGCATLHGDVPTSGRAAGPDLSFVHPVTAPNPQLAGLCAAVPQAVRDHTYVFFINGNDPLYLGNVKGLSAAVKALGFPHCYCGQMGHAGEFRRAIGKVCAAEPEARIVLVGYSAGANRVRDLCHDLEQVRVRVDLLVYLAPDLLRNEPRSRPANAAAVLNITGHRHILLGYDLLGPGLHLEGASNHRLDARHALLPSRPETVDLLVRGIVAACQGPPANAPAQP